MKREVTFPFSRSRAPFFACLSTYASSLLSESLEQATGRRILQVLFGKSSYSSKPNFSAARLELEAIFPAGTIRKDDFQCSTALQNCCDIVYNCYNIVPTLFPKIASLQIISYIIAFRNYVISLSARSKRHLNYITRAFVEPFAKISPMLSGPNVLVLKTFIFSLQNTF